MIIKKVNMFVEVSYPMKGTSTYFSKVFTKSEFDDFENKFNFKESMPAKGILDSECYSNIPFYESGCLVGIDKGNFNIRCKSKDMVKFMEKSINGCFTPNSRKSVVKLKGDLPAGFFNRRN